MDTMALVVRGVHLNVFQKADPSIQPPAHSGQEPSLQTYL
jgi:hypothetical protein